MVLALLLQVILVSLDFLMFILSFGWIKTLTKLLHKPSPRSMAANPKKSSSHRVSIMAKDYPKLLKGALNYPEATTLYELFTCAVADHGPSKALGTREFQGWESKKPPIKRYGRTTWRSFAETKEESLKFGAALRGVGLVAAPIVGSLEKHTTACAMAIFENTCAEWFIAMQGAFSQSMIVTTLYATLGMDAVVQGVDDGNIAAIVCNKKSVKDIHDRHIKGQMPTLKTVIYTNDLCAPDEKIDLPKSTDKLKLISYEDFVNSGDTSKYTPIPPTPTTTAVNMYTSGSTGKPKGVVLTHSHVLSACGGVSSFHPMNSDDAYCGYLPMAHILELTTENSLLSYGCSIGFADPKSLTAKGAIPHGALEEFQPTLMAAVPKIWDTIKKGIEARVAGMSSTKQVLFRTAFMAKGLAIKYGYDTPLFNALVFKKLKGLIGGKMRLALSGGGPLNPEVQDFVRAAFGMPLVQGYGLTETCAGLAIQYADDLRPGIAGAPIPCVEVRLDSCPDITDKKNKPYLNTDTVDVDGNEVFGRGEIVVRGECVSLGYYMMPEKTKEEFETFGWFHTGDIGQFMDDGSLKIVDRKKNLVKLKGGEYIAMEQMEAVYGNSIWVDAIGGGICCYGDGDMDRPIALMQLNETVAMAHAKKKGIEGDFQKVRQSNEIYDVVMKDLLKEHKQGGLAGNEKLVAVAFVEEQWTPENGCLTAANKLQRRAVVESNKEVFDETRKKGIF